MENVITGQSSTQLLCQTVYNSFLCRPTFFTLDGDFYKRWLCHTGYCLVFVGVGQYESASFVRRLLRHKQFNTQAKRMGTVVRVSHIGVSVWYLHAEEEKVFEWMN